MILRKMTSLITMGALVASMGTLAFADTADAASAGSNTPSSVVVTSTVPVTPPTTVNIGEKTEKKSHRNSQKENVGENRNEQNQGSGKISKIKKEVRNQDVKKKDEKAKYTKSELQGIKKIEDVLKRQYKGIRIVPVENVISDMGAFKVDMPVAIKKGIIYMSANSIEKAFGAEVKYDENSKKFAIRKGDVKVEVFVAKDIAKINGSRMKIDAKPIVVKGNVMIPVNAIAKALKVKVKYQADANALTIKSKVPAVAVIPVITVIPATPAVQVQPVVVPTTPAASN
jgi:hypothetical protein